MQYQDNTVVFAYPVGSVIDPENPVQYTNVVYNVQDFCVTSGQDPEGHVTDGSCDFAMNNYVGPDGTTATYTWSIGRSGSGQVADWWNRKIDAAESTFNHGAGTLNFAFIGELSLDVLMLGQPAKTCTIPNVAIAQGHSGASNNWWFGVQGSAPSGDDSITATSTAGDTFTFLRGGALNPDNEIDLVGMVINGEIFNAA